MTGFVADDSTYGVSVGTVEDVIGGEGEQRTGAERGPLGKHPDRHRIDHGGQILLFLSSVDRRVGGTVDHGGGVQRIEGRGDIFGSGEIQVSP